MADPTVRQIVDMQKRLGIQPTGDLIQLKKDLTEVVRLRPRESQKFLKMTREDYEMFGVEPSPNLD